MRVIIKKPGLLPEIATIGDDYRDLQLALGDGVHHRMFERCMVDGPRESEVSVWCDEEYLLHDPRPEINVRRPNDGHPICGTIVVTGTRMTGDGPANGDVSPEDAALWMYILTACSPHLFIGCEVRKEVVSRRSLLDELRTQVPPSSRGKCFGVDAMVAQLGPLPPNAFEPTFTFVPWDDVEDKS